jgi:hypothetical protein
LFQNKICQLANLVSKQNLSINKICVGSRASGISLNLRPIQKPDVGLKPHTWHKSSPDPIHFTIFIFDNTFISPSSSAPLSARPVFLQTPSSIAHHAASTKSDPTHPKQDKKTQRQDAVCI